MAHDQAIGTACSLGNLELNAFLPLVAHALLTSLDLLTNASDVFRRLCVEGIEADEVRCRQHVENATAAVTALVEVIGYDQAQIVASRARAEAKSLRDIVTETGILTGEQFDQLITPEAVTRLGSPDKRV